MSGGYDVIRSRRKTLCLQITREARLVVRAPLRVPQSAIDDFVRRHAGWIEKHLASAGHELERRQGFTFADGQAVWFLGERLTIRTAPDIGEPKVEGAELLLPAAGERELAVTDFLRRQAKALLPPRVAARAAQMGVSPQAVTITSAQTRWGSCSGKNRISFAYRLVCLPPALVDYVVVHELAHILEHNHSARFYARVGRVLPGYRQLQADLKAFRRRLTF